jgi:hypothetical protein
MTILSQKEIKKNCNKTVKAHYIINLDTKKKSQKVDKKKSKSLCNFFIFQFLIFTNIFEPQKKI